MPLLVLKFGGSSVGSPEKIKFVAEKIKALKDEGNSLVVVVSAMGDTTDELISLSEAVSPNTKAVTHEREMDVLLSSGERISMALLSLALRDLEVESISFTGSQAGIITDSSHTRARILEIKPVRVIEELKKNKVVIIAGFQGVSKEKEITTLGRGGSDTTAVAMAVTLSRLWKHEGKNTEVGCEVYTDVEGIYSADPRIVKEAKPYKSLSWSTVLEMAVRGAQVMHARSIELARINRLKLFVGHSKTGVGTMIEDSMEKSLEKSKVHSVTCKKNLILLQIPKSEFESALNDACFMNINPVDIVAYESGDFRVVIDSSESSSFKDKYLKYIAIDDLCGVSLIGDNLLNSPSILQLALSSLKQSEILHLGLTVHTQSFTIWLRSSDASRAVSVLHNAVNI